MQLPATDFFRQLVTLTAPGAPVAPVIGKLDEAVQSIKAARPQLEAARIGAQLLGELDRIQGAAATLRNALFDLRANDDMSTFDAAFAADDADWDAKFTRWADVLDAATAAGSR